MPIARGLMQISRFTILPTVTTLTINPTSPISCADAATVEFNVTVTSSSGTPTGTVVIRNADTSQIVGTGILSAGSVTIPVIIVLSSGTFNFTANYLGKVNSFAPSISAIKKYIINSIPTTTTMVPPVGTYFFCKNSPFTVNAHIDCTPTGATGTSTFVFWKSNTDGYVIGNSTLDGYQNTSKIIPIGAVSDSSSIYVQAMYLGNICYGSSLTPSGISGMLLNQTINNTTTTTISVTGSTTFCINAPLTVNATVTVTNFPNPDVGFVTFFATQNLTLLQFQVGNSVAVTSGLASVVLPGNTFPSADFYFLHAIYSGDGTCFNSSHSPLGITGLAIHPIDCS